MSDHAGAGIEAVRGRVEEVLGTGGFADTDDLFEHGLDSLGLIRLLGAWRESGHDVTFEELAADPTPAAWSALLAERGSGPRTGERAQAPPAEQGHPFPMAAMQHAYWIGRRDDQPLGGVAAHFYTEFDGHRVDPGRLAAALRSVVRRHPMLRARFDDDGRQRVQPRATAPPRPCTTSPDCPRPRPSGNWTGSGSSPPTAGWTSPPARSWTWRSPCCRTAPPGSTSTWT
ncbi:phosphopantetheine-binding protein [Nocardiopsis composta]